MRRAVALTAVAVTALLMTPDVGRAQETRSRLEVTPPNQSAAPDLRATVTLPSTMNDLRVRPDGFSISEDGSDRPVVVEQLDGGELEVVLAIDTSDSMKGEPLRAAKDAAIAFVAKAPPGTRLALVGFGGEPYVASPFSTNRAALQTAIAALETRPETPLFDAVAMASGLFVDGRDAQRSIVVLADGDDTVSRTELTTITGRLAARNIQLAAGVGWSRGIACGTRRPGQVGHRPRHDLDQRRRPWAGRGGRGRTREVGSTDLGRCGRRYTGDLRRGGDPEFRTSLTAQDGEALALGEDADELNEAAAGAGVGVATGLGSGPSLIDTDDPRGITWMNVWPLVRVTALPSLS